MKLFLLSLSLVYYRSTFPDILAYVQPIDDLILSEENVQVSITIVIHNTLLYNHYCGIQVIFALCIG